MLVRPLVIIMFYNVLFTLAKLPPIKTVSVRLYLDNSSYRP